MIKLGDMVEVEYGNSISKMWLVKDGQLKKFFADRGIENKHYKVLGFQIGKGWWTLNNGSLKEMRAFMEHYRSDDKILIEFSKEV